MADPSVDVGVPGGSSLIGLVDAYLLGDDRDREPARKRLIGELGAEGLVDAAAVFGNFEMMNRVAEGTGISVPPQAVERESEMMHKLGLYDILDNRNR